MAATWDSVALTRTKSFYSPEDGRQGPSDLRARPPLLWSTLPGVGRMGFNKFLNMSVHLSFSDVTVGAFMSDSVVLLR